MDKSIVPVNQIATRSSTCYQFSNPNGAEVVEIEDDPVEVVEKQLEELKLNHQFSEKNVPHFFKTLINARSDNLNEINLYFYDKFYKMMFGDVIIRIEGKENFWTIEYENIKERIRTVDLEKSIIDHLWFVLINPNIKLASFTIDARLITKHHSQQLDSKKLDTLFQSMLDSIDHIIHTKSLLCSGFSEDTFLSLLKHVKPVTLESIGFDISWKEAGNYQKLEEIIKTAQWKKASKIHSWGVYPLKIDNLLHCYDIKLQCSSITPEDVLRVTENFFNSTGRKECELQAKSGSFDKNGIMKVVINQNDGSRVLKNNSTKYTLNSFFKIVKSEKEVYLTFSEDSIFIRNT